MESLRELYKVGNGPSSSHTMGPARAARNNNVPSCNDMLCEGDIIVPPCNAADVTIRDLELKRKSILLAKKVYWKLKKYIGKNERNWNC